MTSSLSYWQIYRGPLDEALHTAREPGTFSTVKSSSQVLRICHFGDVGQKALPPEQLEALGKVDVAIMQLDNTFSELNMYNKKGFNMMAQVKPHLIIPTHISSQAAQYAATLWPCMYPERASVKISREALTAETRVLFLGILAPGYAEWTNATLVDWQVSPCQVLVQVEAVPTLFEIDSPRSVGGATLRKREASPETVYPTSFLIT